MGILLILAQVAMIILDLITHTFTLNPWLVWSPAILFGTIWLTAVLFGGAFYVDRVNPIGPRVKRGRR